MKQRSLFSIVAVIAISAVTILTPASARGGGGMGAGGRGGLSGRGPGSPQLRGGGVFNRSGRSLAPRGGDRSPGGLNRGSRGGGRGSDGIGSRDGGGRRGPRDRPNWDGKIPGRRPGRGHGHYPGWYGRSYWGPFGFGAFGGFGSYFYDPFYSPFYSYGGYVDDRDREDDRNIEVQVKPENAQIYVNGLLYSNKGKARFTLPSGPWTVELRAPGYQTERIDLTVEQGKRYRIQRKLQRDAAFDRDGRHLKSEELEAPR